MNVAYLIIVWVICLGYTALNLYFRDFIGRVFSMIILLMAIMYTLVVLSI